MNRFALDRGYRCLIIYPIYILLISSLVKGQAVTVVDKKGKWTELPNGQLRTFDSDASVRYNFDNSQGGASDAPTLIVRALGMFWTVDVGGITKTGNGEETITMSLPFGNHNYFITVEAGLGGLLIEEVDVSSDDPNAGTPPIPDTQTSRTLNTNTNTNTNTRQSTSSFSSIILPVPTSSDTLTSLSNTGSSSSDPSLANTSQLGQPIPSMTVSGLNGNPTRSVGGGVSSTDAADTANARSANNTGAIVGAVLGIFAGVIFCIFGALWYRRRRRMNRIPPSMAFATFMENNNNPNNDSYPFGRRDYGKPEPDLEAVDAYPRPYNYGTYGATGTGAGVAAGIPGGANGRLLTTVEEKGHEHEMAMMGPTVAFPQTFVSSDTLNTSQAAHKIPRVPAPVIGNDDTQTEIYGGIAKTISEPGSPKSANLLDNGTNQLPSPPGQQYPYNYFPSPTDGNMAGRGAGMNAIGVAS